MDNQIVAEGIRRFVANAGASFNKVDEVLSQVAFPGERNPTLIGVEVLGMAISYGTYCGVLPNPSVAPTLLLKNWGGIEGTCFYLSVHRQDGQAWLVLETKQILDSNATPESIASLLGLCRLQWSQANEAIERAFGIR
jgi:hypothetical protein